MLNNIDDTYEHFSHLLKEIVAIIVRAATLFLVR